EQAARLRNDYHVEGKSEDSLREEKADMLTVIYQMFCYFLGEPPVQFDFEYRNKDNTFHRDTALTPASFFKKYVHIDLNDYVSIIHAPTDDKPFNRTYTVNYLGNVKGGQDVRYLNV